ncbi:lipocalin [Gordonia sp. HNM0687]|uniref:Lipocalin n=1 Tax=Gordonia mangrovi TaxID=2665643 RepID=A0A6L7GUQ9_9ACTN|nr:lipocalin family protein [Gordonia mangrovi]MXP23764.1 lipocalin [Gordonia mangrovi]UVF79820.1 lipocalin family protein [Gordonia mangrovi]
MGITRTIRRLFTLLATTALAVAALVASTGPAAAAPLQPIPKLDTERYLGSWWQLAAIPAFFNLNCAKDTKATYTLIDATTIGVENTCTTFTGQTNGITGQAKVVDPVTNAQLSVSFPQVPVSIDPNNAPNYIVTWIADGATPDDPYRFALVGNPTRLSGFVLSREKVVSTDTLRMLRGQVEKAGFNSCTFLVSPTTGGRTDYSPLCTV